ncbi:hypothetical protein H4R35_007211, partial [Dimargaris xerosporica]
MNYGYSGAPYGQQPGYGGGYGGPPAPASYTDPGMGGGEESIEDALQMMDSNPEFQHLFSEASSAPRDGSRSVANPDELAGMHNQVYEASRSTDRGLFSGGSVPFSWQMIAGAAGWQAMKWYNNKQHMSGQKVSHPFMKKAMAAVAMSQAIKLLGSFGINDKRSRDAAAREAATNAMEMYDREVGLSGGGPGGYSNEPGYGPPSGGDFYQGGGGYPPQQPPPYQGGGGYGGAASDYQGGNPGGF